MNYNRAAYRYAKATLASCDKNEVMKIFTDMQTVCKAFEDSNELKLFVDSKVIKDSDKLLTLKEVFQKSSKKVLECAGTYQGQTLVNDPVFGYSYAWQSEVFGPEVLVADINEKSVKFGAEIQDGVIKKISEDDKMTIEDKSDGKHRIKMTLAEEVTFINKGAILKELDTLPENTFLELDVRKTQFLDYDIIEIFEDFSEKAKQREIDIQLISERGVIDNPASFVEYFKKPSKAPNL